jgi:hypothetical protein
MNAKKFTDDVMGFCHLDRYDTCGNHQSFFSDGSSHCDKWQDYFYASSATISAFKDYLNGEVKLLKDTAVPDPHIWVTELYARQAAYDDVLRLING